MEMESAHAHAEATYATVGHVADMTPGAEEAPVADSGTGAALLVFIAGEELNWGQRIFGIETPEAISRRSREGRARAPTRRAATPA